MSYLFNTIHASLAAGRLLIIEPLIRSLIDEKGWQASGVFQIYQPAEGIQVLTEKAPVGRMIFEGSQWHYEGEALSELEQEELAFLIWNYQHS